MVGEEDVSFQDVVSTFKSAGTCSGRAEKLAKVLRLFAS